MPAILDFKGGGAKGWHRFQLAAYKKLFDHYSEMRLKNLTPPEIFFDKESHTYTVDGQKIDSVTTILRSVGLSTGMEYVSEEALWKGQRRHRLFELYAKNNLDETSLDDDLKMMLATFQRFLMESKADVLAVEKPLADNRLGYAGTPDLVVRFPNDKPEVVTVYVLEITPEKYVLTPFNDYFAERVFAAALICHQAKKEMGLTKPNYVV